MKWMLFSLLLLTHNAFSYELRVGLYNTQGEIFSFLTRKADNLKDSHCVQGLISKASNQQAHLALLGIGCKISGINVKRIDSKNLQITANYCDSINIIASHSVSCELIK